jgi:hypothetical protein
VSKVWRTIKHEFFEVLPPSIFFLISFNIVLLDRALMARQYGLELSSEAGATVMALLVAKVVLIADKLPFINRFPEKPLMYNVVWKTAVYVFASLLLHYLEHLTPLWWRLGSFLAANDRLREEIVWPHFWAIQLWLIVLIFVYCATRELVRVIGRERVWHIFFGHPGSSVTRGA